MKKAFILLTICLIVIGIAGCTASPNAMVDVPDEEGDVAGFWQGLWQGLISPITFVISLFSDSLNVYETHNNGGWYNLGFLLGASIVFGGSGGGAVRRRR